LAIVALASVGSHMPSKFRYFSLLHRRVLTDGTSRSSLIRPPSVTNPHTSPICVSGMDTSLPACGR
jgi:hypothetical protein